MLHECLEGATPKTVEVVMTMCDEVGWCLGDIELEALLRVPMHVAGLAEFGVAVERGGHALGERSALRLLRVLSEAGATEYASVRCKAGYAAARVMQHAASHGVAVPPNIVLEVFDLVGHTLDLDLVLALPQRESLSAQFKPTMYERLMTLANATQRYADTLQLFDECLTHCEANDKVCSRAVLALCRTTALPPLSVLDAVSLRCNAVGVLSYSAALSEADTLSGALDVARRMQARGSAPDVTAMQALVLRALEEGCVDEAERWYEKVLTAAAPRPQMLMSFMEVCARKCEKAEDRYMTLAESCFDVLLAELTPLKRDRKAVLPRAGVFLCRLYAKYGMHDDARCTDAKIDAFLNTVRGYHHAKLAR